MRRFRVIKITGAQNKFVNKVVKLVIMFFIERAKKWLVRGSTETNYWAIAIKQQLWNTSEILEKCIIILIIHWFIFSKKINIRYTDMIVIA